MFDVLLDEDATTLAALVHRGELSARELTQAAIDRMEQREPLIKAFCTATPELALQQATAIDARRRRGETLGALAGVPLAVKDLICTAGVKTTSGSAAYADFVPQEDDITVERLLAADAVLLGKTTAPEFGYSGVGHNPLFPSPRNPWDLSKTPGGSSAGSGAALAARLCPMALGSDGGGSVRIPAAHCGVYGLKASMGRVPLWPGCRDERYPGVSSWESLEHIGPMTRTVRDSALMMSVMAGPDMRDRHSIPCNDVDWLTALNKPLEGLRIAFSADFGYITVDPEVRDVVTQAARRFARELGAELEEVDPGIADESATFAALVAFESDLAGMRQMQTALGSRMSPHLTAMLQRDWRAENFTDANTTRKKLCNQMWRFMQRYDLLLSPTLAVPPFPLNMQGPEVIDGRMVRSDHWLSFCFPFNFTGQPAASVPAGFTASGLPIGMQIVGRHLDDGLVLAASAAFERIQPWNHIACSFGVAHD
ncbi:amidase [Candidatus Pantoea floridensis]|uniref:Aspartyl-tRNA(Asn)/glutamyl-tRNA(Gln) amidotransferase subunit A n=1 Tax=Candidatus Pantoea floridensis TaxID=1938870 RepID=A0A286DMQ0_9GAMM|nr:amidase family protein [Pantoea floridensis]PIF14630.1 aspartyl-tRNA(Asn)/glutamyl-tRNA(Gln) amidotransferase subunit A [Enterobacteriaceae bacterium JKS000233]SOD59889.1 aspartyl-tRNA(Asn)/glutamyl-tRNA(Gln) amidotransferase subunit A [Pantoea floridensis]